MGAVDLDRLARSFGSSSDAQLAEQLEALGRRISGCGDDVAGCLRVGGEVPGADDALYQAGSWLEQAEDHVRTAITACEEHQRGVA